MASFRKMSLIAMALLVVGLKVFAADPAGTWTAELETPTGPQMITFEFTVEGSQLSGKTTAQQFGSIEIQQGKIEGHEISFIQSATIQGSDTRIEYKGTVTADEINFKRNVGDSGPQEFVAKRSK